MDILLDNSPFLFLFVIPTALLSALCDQSPSPNLNVDCAHFPKFGDRENDSFATNPQFFFNWFKATGQ